MKNKGFTIPEMLVALLLVGLLLSVLVNLFASVSQTLAKQSAEATLHSVAISEIESLRFTLQQNKTLPSGQTHSVQEVGDIEYFIVQTVEPLSYPGAYKVVISITSQTDISIHTEVILYEDASA